MPSLGLGRFPREGVKTVSDRQVEKPVPGRMEFNAVDPVAITVMSSELGRVAVGEKAPLVDLGGCDPPSKFPDPVDGPSGVVALQCVDQGWLRCGQVVLVERGGLIQDLVGGDPRSLISNEATHGQRMPNSQRRQCMGSVRFC